MDSESKETILVGDFNCDWNTILDNNAPAHISRLADLVTTYQFEQQIKESTQVAVLSGTLIELITMTGVQHIGISDHSLIFVCRKLSIQGKEPKMI